MSAGARPGDDRYDRILDVVGVGFGPAHIGASGAPRAFRHTLNAQFVTNRRRGGRDGSRPVWRRARYNRRATRYWRTLREPWL